MRSATLTLVSIGFITGSMIGCVDLEEEPAAGIDPDVAEELPRDVSFDRDVTPIFFARGCVNCHDGGGIGKDLGGLHLNGASEKMYKELVEEVSANYGAARVDLADPTSSILLTLPSREEPADAHPTVTFESNQDSDYLVILGWIAEGAQRN